VSSRRQEKVTRRGGSIKHEAVQGVSSTRGVEGLGGTVMRIRTQLRVNQEDGLCTTCAAV